MKTNASPLDVHDEMMALKTEIAHLKALVKFYEEQFRLAKHRRIGARSEQSQYDFTQLSIFNEAEQCADANVPDRSLWRSRSITAGGRVL